MPPEPGLAEDVPLFITATGPGMQVGVFLYCAVHKHFSTPAGCDNACLRAEPAGHDPPWIDHAALPEAEQTWMQDHGHQHDR